MSHKQALAVLVSVTLLGFALRLYRIDAVSYRGDEAFTVLNWVSHPLLDTLRSEIPLADPQPPLAFALFRGWSLLFGTGEFAMRVMPALFSLIGIPAVYALGKHLGSRTWGALAALLWALHPFIIWHAQDTKAYAIWAAVSGLALWLALRALDKRRPIDWLLYIAAACIAAYLYYLELFALLALNLFVFIRYWRNWPLLRSWLLSQIVIGFILAPWFIQPRLLFDSGYSGTTFPFEPAQIFTWLIPSLNFGMTLQPAGERPTTTVSIWLLVLFVLLIGLASRWRTNRSTALLLGLCGFLPVLLLSLVSFRMNVFTPRYILSVVPTYTLLAASFILSAGHIFRQPVLRRALPLVLAGGWLCISGISLINYYFVPEFAKAPDWRGLINYLQTHGDPDDFVVQAAADEAFTLYFDDFSDSMRLPANPRQPVDEITDALEQGLATHRSVWLVARAPDDWPNKNVPLEWLANQAQEVRSTTIGGLPARQFMTWQVNEIEAEPLAEFRDTAELVGVQTSLEPANELLVWLYWRPLSTTERPLKAYVHLTGPINPAAGTPLWTQDDHYPQHERISTTNWSPSEVYRDIFKLDLAGVPAGEYDLLAGWYDPETGQRISVNGTDSYRIGSITLP
jgi:4-amino-4-deoxy-L-arabinose transferase-like glycosyltransferase